MIEYKGCTISIQAVLSGGVYKDPTFAISRDGEFIRIRNLNEPITEEA